MNSEVDNSPNKNSNTEGSPENLRTQHKSSMGSDEGLSTKNICDSSQPQTEEKVIHRGIAEHFASLDNNSDFCRQEMSSNKKSPTYVTGFDSSNKKNIMDEPEGYEDSN